MRGRESRILVVHTAFIGDIVLMLPLVQMLRRCRPDAHIAVLAVPTSAGVLQNHPDISEILTYDKRGSDKGLGGMLDVIRRIRKGKYELAIVPHRSLRSAVIVWLGGIQRRIGFATSSGRWLFSETVPYLKERHEILRNLMLLSPLAGCPGGDDLPRLYPSERDRQRVDELLQLQSHSGGMPVGKPPVALAPGSIWNTKRWPAERYETVARSLADDGHLVVLIGGESDVEICRRIEGEGNAGRIRSFAGQVTLLQSAELIRRCAVVVSNDSAPMHLGVAVQTPVVAIFGATVPEFGFAPRGPKDEVVEILDLPCRPCGIHGGRTCPVGTFDCMVNITPGDVLARVYRILNQSSLEKIDGAHAHREP